MKLTGHHVLITGGASGIGLALAREFQNRGNKVTICGRNEEKLRGAALELPGLKTLQWDITSKESLEFLTNKLSRPPENISILINNAAIGDAYCLRREPQAALKLENELQTNLIAPIKLTGKLLPSLLSQSESAIVNITSGFALWPCPTVPGYSIAKNGLRAYTRVLRQQLTGTGVHVCEVLPPVVDTPLVGKLKVMKMSPEKVAKATLRGIEKQQTEIVLGPVKLISWCLRLSPWLLERVMLRYPMPLKDLDTLYRD